uniref:Uncharacterized protein n=1 Tax=Tanacetum cinerariifolium TaxID=118510 RepID=A0A699SBS6_TANCI|nr:hypothetical protein [Tanacetum cinerariifolium]
MVVNGGPATVNGGSPPATVEAATWLAANDLRTRYWAGGGWTNGRMTRHRRYCSSSTRFRWFRKKVSTRYCSSMRLKKKSILEADVAQDDWWIKNITALNDEIWKMTKMPLDLDLLLVGALD